MQSNEADIWMGGVFQTQAVPSYNILPNWFPF